MVPASPLSPPQHERMKADAASHQKDVLTFQFLPKWDRRSCPFSFAKAHSFQEFEEMKDMVRRSFFWVVRASSVRILGTRKSRSCIPSDLSAQTKS